MAQEVEREKRQLQVLDMETAITTAAFFCLLVFFVVLAIAAALKAHEMERERNNNINNQNTKQKNTMKYIANAFSLQMLTEKVNVVYIEEISEATFKSETADAVSAVGHPDTAAVLGVACNRMNVTLSHGDTLYVAQLTGGRLPEGATTLPEGFAFKYYCVRR